MARVQCVVEIHAGEHCENIGLQERHEEFQAGERDGHQKRQDSATDTERTHGRQRGHETGKDLQRDVSGQHVGEKTDGEADRARQEGDDFDHHDQRYQ